MDDDFDEAEEEYLVILQTILDKQRVQREEAEFEDDLIACIGIMVLGLEEAQQLRAERCYERCLYLIRPDLLSNPLLGTPWQVLFQGQNDCAFIMTMGFDTSTFTHILQSGFEDLWNASPIPHKDVSSASVARLTRRSLDATGTLGLVLHFLNSTMIDTTLCEIFAIIPMTVSRYIRFATKILLATLRKMPDAQIKWPTGDEFGQNNQLILARHPLLDGAFGSMDGLNLAVQTSKDQEVENAMYNSWLHKHFVSSVFAFGADSLIMGCNLNAPGSWHDLRVAQPIYEKLRTKTPAGYYLVTDTAFPWGTDQISGKIRAPIKDGTWLPADRAQRKAAMDFDRQLLSYRQTAEWEMHMIQGSFGRLQVPLPINYNDLCGDLLEAISWAFNLHTRSVGHNQIRTVYKDVWAMEAQLWIDFEKMLFSDQRKNDCVGRFYMIAVEQ